MSDNPVLTPVVWAIGGSDCGGGAGIQADLAAIRTFAAHPCTVLSALTAQNSLEVRAIEPCSAAMFRHQLQVLADDLMPNAIKTGMLASAEQVRTLATFYQEHLAGIPLIIDPVTISTSGKTLADKQVVNAICSDLLPLATLITPNITELELLCGNKIQCAEDTEIAARNLLQQGVQAVLVKGGHADWQQQSATDYFYSNALTFTLTQPRQDTVHSHGTGCTMASAIAALIAQRASVADAVIEANAYIARGLSVSNAIGSGPGPMTHTVRPVPGQYFASLKISRPELQHPPLAAFNTVGTDKLGFYPVVDNTLLLEKLLVLGVKTAQIRIKLPVANQSRLTRKEAAALIHLESEIAEAILLGKRYDARVFINDHWQLAIRYGAYGVHLGQEDIADADLNAIQKTGLRLGISTHGYYELLRAMQLAPSYIALGHVFATPTKAMQSAPQGLTRLREYAQFAAGLPTVAIGGIDLSNAAAVKDCGVGSLAVVRAVTDSDDLQACVEAFTSVIGL